MTTQDHIVVAARWQVPVQHETQVLDLLARLKAQSLAEPGCLGYTAFRDVDEQGSLLLLEQYRDAAALEAHRASSHYRELVVQRIIPLLTGRGVELLHYKAANA